MTRPNASAISSTCNCALPKPSPTRTATPVAEAVLLYTNFHRRFGLRDVTPDGPHPSWHVYARELSRLGSHEARAGWTQAFYAQSPRGTSSRFRIMCSAASISMPAMTARSFACTSIIAIRSVPLSKARAGERRRELADMFAYIKKRFPHVTQVEGRSWLYGTEAYRRLFPEEYVQFTRSDRRRRFAIPGHGAMGAVSRSRRQGKAGAEGNVSPQPRSTGHGQALAGLPAAVLSGQRTDRGFSILTTEFGTRRPIIDAAGAPLMDFSAARWPSRSAAAAGGR